MSVQDGLSKKESFKPSDSRPPVCEKTGRLKSSTTDNAPSRMADKKAGSK